MKINVNSLVNSIKESYPMLVTEINKDKDFYQVVVAAENGAKVYLYPNDEAWFVKMYPSHEDYERYVLESIRETLMVN